MSLNLRAGDLVAVRSEAEILATLDENGCIDGMPFMPEMLAHCGKIFRVDKRADKTCDTIDYSGNRRMYDTVHLGGIRCDGAAHGGCQAHCPLYWKEAWVERVNVAAPVTKRADQTSSPAPGRNGEGKGKGIDRPRLIELTVRPAQAGQDEVRYRCQATEIPNASFPMKWWDFRQYVRDVRSGNIGVMDLVRAAAFRLFRRMIMAHWFRGHGPAIRVYNRFQEWRGGPPYPLTQGTLDKTPRVTLELKPGELVQVKSQREILETVDRRSRNRGLSFDGEMVRYCGTQHRVLGRVERIINERTGEMITITSDSILLEGTTCQATCSHKRMFCPRQLDPFWREIWLERVSEPVGGDAQAIAATPLPELQFSDS